MAEAALARSTIMRQRSQKTRADYPRLVNAPRPVLEMITAKRAQRFIERIDDSGGPFACWPCGGAPGPNGYRLVQGCDDYQGFTFTAHRVAWALHNGREPALHILHSCDNPPCCNWRHLREGTPLDNVHDMIERGRRWQGKRGLAKVNREGPEAARQARYVDLQPIAVIAAALGVHRSTIIRWLAPYR